MAASISRGKKAVLKVQYTTQTPERWRKAESSPTRLIGRTYKNAYSQKRKALADHLRTVRKDPLSRKALRSEVKRYKLL